MSKRKNFLCFLLGNVFGLCCGRMLLLHNENEWDKKNRYLHVYENWLMLKENGLGLKEYFVNNSVKKVAIYGYGRIGKNLYLELMNLGIIVEYIVDRQKGLKLDNIRTYQPNEKLPLVDVIIVTPVMEYDNIVKSLKSIYDGKIVSLEDVIYECL